jgi:Protein of unknown function (DUF2934).
MEQRKFTSTKKSSKQPKSNKVPSTIDRSTAPERLETNQHKMSASARPVTQEQIAKRAYEIWNERGRPSGCDVDHWVEAERELLGRNSNNT